METFKPDFSLIKTAYEKIGRYIHRTPVLHCESINNMVGADLFFKCENFQKVGAFKFRGAMHAILSLSNEELACGIATHSSGNHAAALALAAAMRNSKAHIVMPENSPEIKKKAVAGYGANITFCKPSLDARESTLKQVVELTGATFIHPFNNPYVISGQGTAVMEFLEEIPDLDIVITPVGGGGLLSGTAIAAKNLKKNIQIFGAEPKGADDAFQSYINKTFVPQLNPQTIADGLRTSLGSITFEIILQQVDGILTCTEPGIVNAMKTIWERMKLVIEPSSAVPLACIFENQLNIKNKKVGIILSGGNVDLGNLPF